MSSKAGNTGFKLNYEITFPSGLPRWDISINPLGFCSKILRIVDFVSFILVVSLTIPSFRGTLKSTLSKTL